MTRESTNVYEWPAAEHYAAAGYVLASARYGSLGHVRKAGCSAALCGYSPAGTSRWRSPGHRVSVRCRACYLAVARLTGSTALGA